MNEFSPINHVFERNRSALAQVNQRLCHWMDNAPTDPTLRLLQLDENRTDLLIRISSGKEIRYYGGSPSVEAEYSVIHGLDLSAGSITCIVGVGLGYTVRAMLNKMTPGHHILVLEPHPGILKFQHLFYASLSTALPALKAAVRFLRVRPPVVLLFGRTVRLKGCPVFW